MRWLSKLAVASVFSFLACGNSTQIPRDDGIGGNVVIVTGNGGSTAGISAGAGGLTSHTDAGAGTCKQPYLGVQDTAGLPCDEGPLNYVPIIYQGGPVMSRPTNVYYIWYGDWSNNTAPEILERFMANVDASDWFAITSSGYYSETALTTGQADGGTPGTLDGGVQSYVTGQVTLVSSVSVGYSHGDNLRTVDITEVIQETIDSKAIPLDSQGIYFVLPSSDVTQEDPGGWAFCAFYCGWHDSAVINGAQIKLAFVGNPDQCPDACSSSSVWTNTDAPTNSPNGNWGADDMISIIAHELVESLSDPFPDATENPMIAWQDLTGAECADKCAWTYGPTYCTPNGAAANLNVGGHDYLVQQNWVNKPGCGRCDMKP